MAGELVRQDPNLDLITHEVVSTAPVEAIIIVGSRATGQGLTNNSDYDVSVVMELWKVPLYLSKLKKVERTLAGRLGIGITISPLPTYQMHNSAGNLYLLKMKREGITLYGKDWIEDLDPGEPRHLKTNWHFSYLFTAMKHMVERFQPGLTPSEYSDTEQEALVRDVAKSVLYCGEIYSLLAGYYCPQAKEMIDKLSRIERIAEGQPQFLEDLRLSSDIRSGLKGQVEDIAAFWFRGRDYLLLCFRELMGKLMETKDEDLEALIERYFAKRRGSSMKNLQYIALTFLGRRELWWRSLLTQRTVEDRLRVAALRLLSSVGEDGAVAKDGLKRTYMDLLGYTRLSYSTDGGEMWIHVRDTVESYWPYACVLMGL